MNIRGKVFAILYVNYCTNSLSPAPLVGKGDEMAEIQTIIESDLGMQLAIWSLYFEFHDFAFFKGGSLWFYDRTHTEDERSSNLCTQRKMSVFFDILLRQHEHKKQN